MSARTTGLLVVVILVASACSSTTTSGVSSVAATGSVPVTTVPESSTIGQSAADATTTALSHLDVTIVDASAPISSTSALTLTRTQVDFMEAETIAHRGLRGDVLDAAGGAHIPGEHCRHRHTRRGAARRVNGVDHLGHVPWIS